ncbi:MAG TPA: hypothetical protein VEC36_13980 [Patescibacteria group bacterium]|nr:hypothetical protein [Patescibacteria group bacterium]
MKIEENILETIRQTCEENGVHLVSAALRGGSTRQRLEIFIDSENGVTHENCQNVSHALDEKFENTDFIDAIQHIDVSSPGADSPLLFSWQYKKHTGRTLEGVLKNGTAFKGKILESDDVAVTIEPEVDKKTLKRHQKPEPIPLPFDEIKKAQIVLNFK